MYPVGSHVRAAQGQLCLAQCRHLRDHGADRKYNRAATHLLESGTRPRLRESEQSVRRLYSMLVAAGRRLGESNPSSTANSTTTCVEYVPRLLSGLIDRCLTACLKHNLHPVYDASSDQWHKHYDRCLGHSSHVRHQYPDHNIYDVSS